MNSYLKAIASYLPERIVSNEELVREFPEWTVDKIAEKVGVKERHVAAENETAADMAIKAASILFEKYPEIKKEDIDFVLFCTQSPDYFLPTSACIIQEKLGLPSHIGALDYNLGCSGFVYGLALAKGLVAGGIATNVLLLTAETYNKHLHPKDKGNKTIFGDGATATVISNDGIARIGDFALGTDGRGAENLIIKTGGCRNPQKADDLQFDENGNPVSSDHLFMNGSEIFIFTQRNVPKVIKAVIEKNGLTSDDVDSYILHQANSYMLEFLRKKMKIEEEKFIVDMEDTGNTVSSSIPLVIEKCLNRKELHGNVVICGFGVGYSWGATVLKFP